MCGAHVYRCIYLHYEMLEFIVSKETWPMGRCRVRISCRECERLGWESGGGVRKWGGEGTGDR